VSGLDDLLARSRSPGTFVERREFTLSRDKAVEKLREFSLRHPAGYVLELVQAAVFAGATYIAIDVSDSELLVAWVGGEPCEAQQLEHIFDYLFITRTDTDTRHLSQLAIGLNALLQRKPKLVRIESGDGTVEGTVRVDLDRRGQGSLGRPELAMAGTYLLVQFASGWFDRFDGEDFHAEEALVESRCLYSPVPILLNGRAPFGYRPNRNLRMFGTEDEIGFDDQERRGVVAIPGAAERSAKHRAPLGLRLVVGGVWITTLDLPVLGQAPPNIPLVGVVCDDRLRKTADQSDIVQDASFVRMLHAVQPWSTELIRRSAGPSWEPPELPPLPEERSQDDGQATGPAAEPLPVPIPQLGARDPLHPDRLGELPVGTRVFWVRPEDLSQLELSADPGRFPFPVLELSPGQARSLALQAPGLALAALSTTADVDFVLNTLERQGATHTIHGVLEHGGRQHPFTVRLDLSGRPDPTRDRRNTTPLSMGSAKRSVWCGSLDLHLPGVTVHLVAEGAEPGVELEEALAERVVDVAWRWLLPGEHRIPGDDAALRDLRCALLRESLRPLFLETEEGVRLELLLLGADPEQWELVLDLPLASATGGPLTLRRLHGLQGRPEVVELVDPAERLRLLPLEDLLGWGHLSAQQDDAYPLCALGSFAGGWRSLSRGELHGRGYGHVLYVPTSFRTPPQLADWVPRPLSLPGVGAVSAPGAPAEPDWSRGLRMLAREMARSHRIEGWSDLAGEATPAAQRAAMGRLALSVLEALPPEGDIPFREPMERRVPYRERAFIEDHAPVVPRGGAHAMDHDVLELSLDELVALEHTLAPRRLRLHLDDAPQSYGWGDGEGGWVLRQAIRGAGMRGFIGLREPFDPSAAVLIHSSRSLHALYSDEHHLPVHGWVRLAPGATVPGEDQVELLLLERLLLYQKLHRALSSHQLEGEALVAGRHYAAAFALDAWRRGQLDRSMSRGLAEAVPAGGRLSLLDVLEGGSQHPLPASLPTCLVSLHRAGPLRAPARARGFDLAQRFQRAIGPGFDLQVRAELQYLETEGERVRLVQGVDRPVFLLNLRNTDVTRVVDAGGHGGSMGGHRRGGELVRSLRASRDLILLDMAWRFVRWARERGFPADLPSIHRALLAASLER
jgi:hypothetical protein